MFLFLLLLLLNWCCRVIYKRLLFYLPHFEILCIEPVYMLCLLLIEVLNLNIKHLLFHYYKSKIKIYIGINHEFCISILYNLE